jgi:hypothetical protein
LCILLSTLGATQRAYPVHHVQWIKEENNSADANEKKSTAGGKSDQNLFSLSGCARLCNRDNKTAKLPMQGRSFI